VNFESNGYTGKKVKWQGDPVSDQVSDFKIKIESIVDKSGTHNILTNVQGSSGKIVADVKSDVADQTVETYTINFKIEPKPNPNNQSLSFPLDPKLKANT
jgi:hypothetical protein